ncbi:hypothetical protein BS50DRAFT_580364, partial [Corynespora cassiicola Philippines]
MKDAEKALRSQTVGPRPGICCGDQNRAPEKERMSPQACVRAAGAFGLVQDNY